jgi:hypothetical protein
MALVLIVYLRPLAMSAVKSSGPMETSAAAIVAPAMPTTSEISTRAIEAVSIVAVIPGVIASEPMVPIKVGTRRNPDTEMGIPINDPVRGLVILGIADFPFAIAFVIDDNASGLGNSAGRSGRFIFGSTPHH